MEKFEPFANDVQSASVGDLTIENGIDEIAVYGELRIRKDQSSRRRVEALKDHLDRILEALPSA